MSNTPVKDEKKRSVSETSISPINPEAKKSKRSMEEMLEDVSIKLGSLTTEFNSLKSVVTSTNSTVSEIQLTIASTKEVKQDVVDIKEEVEALRCENTMLKASLKQLMDKVTDLEYHQKRNNLLFEGIPEESRESAYDCYTKVIDLLSGYMDTKEIKVARCHHLGKRQVGYNRSIIANFHWFGDVTNILVIKNRLPKGIYIKEDLPKVWEDSHRVLRPFCRAASSLNKLTSLSKGKIYIDSTQYTCEDIASIPADVGDLAKSEKTDDEKVLYFGPQSEYSNMSLSPFRVENIEYHSNEQYI